MPKITRPGKVKTQVTYVLDEIKIENGNMKWRDRIVTKDEYEQAMTYGK
jgi:hypothetical protein